MNSKSAVTGFITLLSRVYNLETIHNQNCGIYQVLKQVKVEIALSLICSTTINPIHAHLI